jgi:hypothetical protein
LLLKVPKGGIGFINAYLGTNEVNFFDFKSVFIFSPRSRKLFFTFWMLTYMLTLGSRSVDAAIANHLEKGELVQWIPRRRGFGEERIFLVSARIAEELGSAWGGDNSADESMRQMILATIDLFVAGVALETIFKSLDKKRGVKDGTGISELRVLKPRPGVRILGGFLTEAAFIGLIMERRNRIAFKHKASEAGQRQWYELKAEALATFKTLFPNEKPLIPNALRDLESLGDEQ